MSILNNSLLLGAPAGSGAAYQISRSLRFNSADSAYLSRTPASAGNRKTWTWAGWVKKRSSTAGAYSFVFSCIDVAASNYLLLDHGFDVLTVYDSRVPSTVALQTSQVFRDFSAWHHIVLAADFTQAVAANRYRLYVNGSEVTVFLTDNRASITQNSDGYLNSAVEHSIGSERPFVTNARYFDGYLADIHFIDGQALAPSSFAETNVTTGQWVPKAYTGTYGTNGFRLDFSDNSAATATTLGKDRAGSNNWTPNNLSVTAGAGNDSLVDTPSSAGTDTGVGGQVTGNYATWNPLVVTGVDSFGGANGNLDSTGASRFCSSTIGVSSGKWYTEITIGNSDVTTGIWQPPFVSSSAPASQKNYRYYGVDGKVYSEAGATATSYSSYTSGDVIGIALDLDNGRLFFAKNGTWQGSSVPASGTNPAVTGLSGTWVFGVNHTTSATHSANFGQRPFAYTAPSGFKALCDTNLPAPVVAKPSTVFDTVLYTANVSGGKTISMPGGSSPDLVWIKNRDNVEQHYLADTVRGDGANKYLRSNSTNAEGGVISGDCSITFNSSSFTLTDPDWTIGELYFQNRTYVAWCWDAGSSNATNTSGTITSTVRANVSAGFSIVTYTGNGTAGATVGHGLGVAPTWIMIKGRSSATSWNVYTTALDGSYDFFVLNSTADKADSAQSVPTSSVFSVSNGSNVNGSGTTYVAYCWTPVAGLSRTFTWTGNGAADGPYVHLGFRPAFLLLKQATTSSATNWILLDNKRLGYNVDNDPQYPNLASADGTADLVDFTANGLKIRNTDASINANNGTYVGFAMAEFPFQYARAR